MNVWVENGHLYFYFSRRGTFDEHNTFLKMGRIKVRLDLNPFGNPAGFRQELLPEDGSIRIQGKDGKIMAGIELWVDVFQPVIHNGQVQKLKVQPAHREKHVVNLFGMNLEEKAVLSNSVGQNNEKEN